MGREAAQTYKPEWPEMVDLKTKIDQKREDLDKLIDESVNRARQVASAEYQLALRRENALSEEVGTVKSQTLDQAATISPDPISP